jgi:hypothetical protein
MYCENLAGLNGDGDVAKCMIAQSRLCLAHAVAERQVPSPSWSLVMSAKQQPAMKQHKTRKRHARGALCGRHLL